MSESDEVVEARWNGVTERIIAILREDQIEPLEAWFILVRLADVIKKHYDLEVPEMPIPPHTLM